MSNTRTEYDDVCDVVSVESGKVVSGEIVAFKELQYLTVAINRSVKVSMQWDEGAEKYIGRMAGMELMSDGPKSYTYKTSR